MRRRRAVRRQYRNAFYAKQQLRHFHGKVKEEAFKKFIRNHLTSITKRNTSFFAMLEKRLDVFFSVYVYYLLFLLVTN
jgi:ribosomal protein S4